MKSSRKQGLFVFCVIFAMTSCSSRCQTREESQNENYLNFLPLCSEMMTKECFIDDKNEIITAMKQKYSMYLLSKGVTFSNGLQLNFSFHVQKPITKQEARMILIIHECEIFSKINNNKEKWGFPRNFQFTPNDLSITLFITNPDGGDRYHPEICRAEISGTKLIYKTTTKTDPSKYKSVTESFEDATHAMVAGKKGEKY